MNFSLPNKIAENTISSRKRIHHFYRRKMAVGLGNEFYFYGRKKESARQIAGNTNEADGGVRAEAIGNVVIP